MHPSQYPRRVLLCVTGTSPQIITETLYGLAVEPGSEPAFVPTEVRVLTTAMGAQQARLSLLAEDRDMFGKLCRDYGLTGIHFDAECIEVFKDAQGRPLDDILTPEHNEAAADHITRVVAALSSDPNAAIHASIAGGRKTMGFYLGYAMSLFGREQDRVSHVLVSEGFDSHREFFYKPPRPVTLKKSDGWEMSTKDAQIHLAQIPIVRLRSTEFEAVSDRRLGFAAAVDRANRLAGGGDLRIVVSRARSRAPVEAKVWIAGERIKLTQPQAFLLHWMALRRRKEGRGGAQGWVSRNAFGHEPGHKGNLRYFDELIALARRYGELSKAMASLDKGVLSHPNSDPKYKKDPLKWLEPLISNINKQIRYAFGPFALEQYGIVTGGQRGELSYRVAIDPDRIHLEE
jgi:CRISPR-associated protein (TIGR02584 family)